MLSYKPNRTKIYERQAQVIDVGDDDSKLRGELSKEQKNEIHNLYHLLFCTNPETESEIFCTRLGRLAAILEHAKNIVEFNTEYNNLNFFRSIVSLLKKNNEDVVLATLSFINQILYFRGQIEIALLETDLVEVIVSMVLNITPCLSILFNILKSLSTCSREYTNKNETPPITEGLFRILNQTSIDELFDVAIKSDIYGDFVSFLYSVSTAGQLSIQMQEFILYLISEKYNNGEEKYYFYYIYILANISQYPSFPLGLFFGDGLQKFVVDMINRESEKNYIFPSLKTITNICKLEIPESQEIPAILTSIEERIFNIAGDYLKSEATRIAAFDALRYMLTTLRVFQRFDNSIFDFLADKWILVMKEYDSSSFKVKASIVQLLFQFLIKFTHSSNDATQSCIFIQNMINNEIVRIFYEATELHDPHMTMHGLAGLNFLADQCNLYGCDGMLEKSAAQFIDINAIIDIIDNGFDMQMKKQAAIFHSRLIHLPNKLFSNTVCE